MNDRTITTRRTIRKYLPKEISNDILLKCVDAARLAPCGKNGQPLKYIIVDKPDLMNEMFSMMTWAGFLPAYYPSTEEMPRAYIIILIDTTIQKNPRHDAGLAAMSISIAASEQGLGSCILGSANSGKLRKMLYIPDNLDLVLVISLGYPAEAPVIAEMKDGATKYWLDDNGVLHVPKRRLEDIVNWNQYDP